MFVSNIKRMKEETVYFDNIVFDVVYHIGTNAKDNFDVIDKGEPEGYWFHAKDMSSCHVVCNIPDLVDKQGLRTIIKRGAQLCKQNTNKLMSLKDVEIIYTRIKHLTKTEIDGCVITKKEKTIVC